MRLTPLWTTATAEAAARMLVLRYEGSPADAARSDLAEWLRHAAALLN